MLRICCRKLLWFKLLSFMHLGCHPRPGPGPARGRIPEPGPVTRDPNPGSSTHCVLDPGPGPARDPSSGPGRVTDDNQVMHHWRRRFPVIARFIVFFVLIKVSRYPNMGFTTNLASGHYLSSLKTMMLLRICFWPNSYTFDSSRSSIFPFKTNLMSNFWLQCSCFRELVISTHHHKKQ